MDLLSQLNPSQAQAVQAIEGPVLVLAGPGSGKTRVLTHRIAYLVKQCQMDPYNLMAVTFTNKAAREMRERLAKLIGQTNLDRLTVGTFHAICARILRREAQAIGMRTDFVIYDRDDQLSLLKSALRELNLDEKMYRPPAIQAAISRAKRSLLAPGEYNPPTYWDEVVSRVYERYQKLLQQNSAVDFDDLMMLTTRMFEQHKQILHKYQQRYIQVLVDEFQDTDSAQYMLVRQLTAVRKNLFVVGDEDQSIYGWRGADYRNIQRFRQDFPAAQVILLEQNYRSTQNILDAARHVIALNRQRTDKRLWTQNDSGMPVTVYEAYDEQEEAEYVVREIESLARLKTCRYRDCAVMYRTNAQSRVIEDAFVRHGLPYKLVGATRFYERREIKDVLAYMRLAHNPHDDVSLQRVLNVPPRGIGQRTQETLQQFASQHSLPLYAAMQLLQAAQVARPGAKQGEDEEDRGDPQPSPPVDGRAAKALLSLLAMLDKLLTAREKSDPVQLIDLLLTESGYKDLILDGTDEGQERWENVQELRTVASKYKDQPPEEGLTAFLEDVALVSDVDNLTEEGDAPTLLTLHMAKGLEYSTVFMVGLEEGILPHNRSLEEPDEMEEERRLCYVGMTRAKQRLYLIHTFRRARFGNQGPSEPSRFLGDIPARLVKGREVRAPTRIQGENRAARPAAGGSAAGSFQPGDRVRHPQFGEGTVVSSQRRSGDEEVTVVFVGKVGIKRLLAGVAGLKRIGRPS